MSKSISNKVITAKQIRDKISHFLGENGLSGVSLGLPELDSRNHIWRTVILNGKNQLGEIALDASTLEIIKNKTTSKKLIKERLKLSHNIDNTIIKNNIPHISTVKNTVGWGDSEELLAELPNESVDLVFTSPPYYNARLEYAEYLNYDKYLSDMKKIIHKCYRVLNEGRFFVINISPVLIKRSSRSEASKRLAVPFDFHKLFIEENFEFIDDIIWEKPEGAGWTSGRGRGFSVHRTPLAYKPVPITEYILVYRKQTNKLIDWNIRKHPNQELVEKSKISGNYDVTNIWKIAPTYDKVHPAVFPIELAKRVIKYYSFINDVVLDPFGGTGTTALASVKLKRRFIYFEKEDKYLSLFKEKISSLGVNPKDVNWINTKPSKCGLFA